MGCPLNKFASPGNLQKGPKPGCSHWQGCIKDVFIGMVAHCDIKDDNSYFNNICVIYNSVRRRGGWKTFTGPEHKFSIDFPADRSIKSINSLNDSNQSPILEFKGRDFGATSVIMPDINIDLKEYVDKKLSNESSYEQDMVKEAAPVAVNGELERVFSYNELDSNDKMTIEAVLARSNKLVI